MKELLAVLNPLHNPAFVAWERMQARVVETALKDDFFVASCSAWLNGMLQTQKMFDQWLSMMGGAPSVEGLKDRLAGLETRLENIVQRNNAGAAE